MPRTDSLIRILYVVHPDILGEIMRELMLVAAEESPGTMVGY